MERVKILKPLFVVQTGLQYREGDECDVPKAVAERQVKTGYMKIISQPKAVPEAKKVSVKKPQS